jgi:REP element-mobilizing transposase RayT
MHRELLEPGCLYHIYNHAVGGDKLFLSEENYYYFLRRYKHFIPPIAETYAYCLIPNHIHFSVEIKRQINVPVKSRLSPSQYISKQFSNLFSSYAQAFNKQQGRMGNLFISNFKRRKIDRDEYLTNVIKYIHLNPVTHGLVKVITQWKFNSYNAICSPRETFIAREKVLKWFGGVENFKLAHCR